MSDQDVKQALRLLFTAKRQALSIERREAAQRVLISTLLPLLEHKKAVLSFHCFLDEIDLTGINHALMATQRLYLPRVEGDGLGVYAVTDLHRSLTLSLWGVEEPNPALCPLATGDQIDCVILPGLVFDRARYRLGYGKGYYDRLLAQLKVDTIGVGFTEQLYEGELPRDVHDIPLDQLILV